MSKEELLQMLKEKGMEDAAIKTLLSDALSSLEGEPKEPTEEEQKEEAGNLLGVAL